MSVKRKRSMAGMVLLLVLGLPLALLVNRTVALAEASELPLFDNVVEGAMGAIPSLLDDPLRFSLSTSAWTLSLFAWFAPFLGWMLSVRMAGNYRPGEEQGSSKWMSDAEMEGFGDKKEAENNLILSRNARMAFEPKGFNLEKDRNKNVLIIGGPGSGKTRYEIKPNLMQLNSSIWVTDPKGTLLPEAGQMFLDAGYALKTFNTIDFKLSLHFNPFAYIHSEKDIPQLVECIVKNIKPKDAGKSNDPFWESSEKELISSLVAYMYEALPPEQRTFRTLSKLLAMIDPNADERHPAPIDVIFDMWETGKRPKLGYSKLTSSQRAYAREGQAHPDSYAVSLFKKFRTGNSKTLQSVLMTVHADLWQFELKEVLDITDYDEMDLDSLGGLCDADLDQRALRDPSVLEPGAGRVCGATKKHPGGQRKTAMFVIMDDADSTYGFLIATLTYLGFNRIKTYADRKCGGRLPIPVQFYLDEFANIGVIADFQQLISTLRSRNIAVTIVLQSVSQLDSVYGEKEANIIKDCCDTWLYLGGCGLDTCKVISERLGNETVNNRNWSKSYGPTKSTSSSEQILQRPLLDASEVGKLPRRDCLVLISGADGYRDEKYRIEDHPRYELIDPGHKGKKKTLGLFGRGWPEARYSEPFDATAYKRRLLAQKTRNEFRGIALTGDEKRVNIDSSVKEKFLETMVARLMSMRGDEEVREYMRSLDSGASES